MAQNVQIGTIHQIMPKQDITGKQSGRTITKRELYLRVDRYDPDTNEIITTKYPKFEFIGQRCDLLDRFQQGQKVAVYYSLDGNFFPTKDVDQNGQTIYGHTNNITGYKILSIEEYKAANGRGQQMQQIQEAAAPQMPMNTQVQAIFAGQPVQQPPMGYNPQAAGFGAPQGFMVPQPNGMMQ